MKLIAIHTIFTGTGQVKPGEAFECADAVEAQHLVNQGFARIDGEVTAAEPEGLTLNLVNPDPVVVQNDAPQRELTKAEKKAAKEAAEKAAANAE